MTNRPSIRSVQTRVKTTLLALDNMILLHLVRARSRLVILVLPPSTPIPGGKRLPPQVFFSSVITRYFLRFGILVTASLNLSTDRSLIKNLPRDFSRRTPIMVPHFKYLDSIGTQTLSFLTPLALPPCHLLWCYDFTTYNRKCRQGCYLFTDF
jgi:hypothetical protein